MILLCVGAALVAASVLVVSIVLIQSLKESGHVTAATNETRQF